MCSGVMTAYCPGVRRLGTAAACRRPRIITNFPLEGLDFNDYYVETSQALLPGAIANFEQLGCPAIWRVVLCSITGVLK